jgi:hypothetical protein
MILSHNIVSPTLERSAPLPLFVRRHRWWIDWISHGLTGEAVDHPTNGADDGVDAEADGAEDQHPAEEAFNQDGDFF